MTRETQFEIALSFAGEDRLYVDQVANLLRSSGVKVFYDLFEESSLWGKNLYDYLSDVYQNKALYTIMFISKHYAGKLWPTHERQAMQARAFQEHQEYVLPARFDSTAIPGVLPTVAYVSLVNKPPQEFVKLIHKKLVHAGRSIPSEQLRNAVFAVESPPRVDPTEAVVHVLDEDGNPLEGATVTALADNSTFKDSVSSGLGIAKFTFQTRRALRILVAHPNRPGAIFPDWDPADDLRATLPASENTGSVIFHSTGYIPGLEGRLNPILDTSNLMYLYADNIAIRGGEQQPARFVVGVPFGLEDSNGVFMQVKVLHIQGRTSLLQYVHARRGDA
ncbi:MAG: toll/interleukin-1 receptor domain-containing protein [Burkholderiaceae bacterium]|nr:toll/interleukin-1 receptor domain-containing protein [Burkholderiaceae bacterium]